MSKEGSPVQEYAPAAGEGQFAASYALFDGLVGWLGGDQSAGLTHAQVEERIHSEGIPVLRQLMQDHFDLQAGREQQLEEVIDADGQLRGWAQRGRARQLATRFGSVTVTRIAYRSVGQADLHPQDAVSNLPVEKHSHGVRRLAAAAAADVDAFYTAHAQGWSADGDVLALSFDAKGVVMRPDGLRSATAKAAVSQKLAARRSKGEKRNRKRMCEVAAVFDVAPAPRTIADILPEQAAQTATAAPVTSGKWLHASVTEDAAAVIAAGFAEADRRDPDHTRTWIALVDGNQHQIDRIHAEAKTRKTTIPVVVDFIHVIEYIWKAAWCFHPEGDPNAEQWVRAQARQVLAGRAGIVAAAIRRKATYHGLDPAKRKPADTAAAYLLAKKPYLDYPTALAQGWPIATGVIEGACRHLVKDRMDVTGARWGLDG